VHRRSRELVPEPRASRGPDGTGTGQSKPLVTKPEAVIVIVLRGERPDGEAPEIATRGAGAAAGRAPRHRASPRKKDQAPLAHASRELASERNQHRAEAARRQTANRSHHKSDIGIFRDLVRLKPLDVDRDGTRREQRHDDDADKKAGEHSRSTPRVSRLVHRFDEIDHMGVGFIFAETTCSLTA
jgi:hypothetical protein